MAISRDGSTIASGSGSALVAAKPFALSGDFAVKVWDTTTSDCLATLLGHTKTVSFVAISGDGCMVVSASHDETIKVWDLQTLNCLITLRQLSLGGWVTKLAISWDGSTICLGLSDETVVVLDARTGDCHATYQSYSIEAIHAWQTVGVWNDYAISDKHGQLQRIPIPDGAAPLTTLGQFDMFCGPLVDDKTLAFNSKGEALWFQIRRRDEHAGPMVSQAEHIGNQFNAPQSPIERFLLSAPKPPINNLTFHVHWTANPKRVSQLQQLFREVHRHWSSISSHVPFWNRSISEPPNPSCDTLEINPVVLQSHVAEYERQCQQWLTLSWWQKKTTPSPRFPSIQDMESESAKPPNA